MKMNQILKVLCCFAVTVGLGYSSVRGPNYRDIRALGMGNTTVAVTTDRTAIFHNPAGLCMIDDVQYSITPIAVAIDGIFITLLKEMVDQGDKLSNLDSVDASFIEMINEYDGQWVGFEYLPEITVASENLGFGMYSVFPIGVRIESGHLIPKLAVRGQRDLVFTWATGMPLRHKNNYCGISVEYLQRTPLDMITTYSETFILFDEIAKNPLGIIGDYSRIKHGVSFDVGFMHNLNGFRIAYDVRDIFGVVGGEVIVPPQVDVGCAYYFPQLKDVKAIKNLIIALEFTDIFGLETVTEKYEQFWKKTHFGVELDMDYAALRVGLSQGYPTAGLGLRFGIFKTDYVFFTEEVGYYAGQLPKYKHVLAMGFEFNVERKKGRGYDIIMSDLYNKAMTLYSQGKYYDASFVYGKLITEYPDFFKNDWAYLYFSHCQEEMDMRDVSNTNYTTVKKRYSRSDIIPYADLGIMRIHYRNGNSAGVAQQFALLNQPQVKDSLKYHAYYYQGQTHLRDKEYIKAISMFKLIPHTHEEYIFAQHSLAVAHASNDNLEMALEALDNIVQATPKTNAEKEIVNRSFVFLGYIYYEGLKTEDRALSKAVAALRKVPTTSYYYEDAILGLAWCGLAAQQWTDCLAACATLKTVSKKPILHSEAVLLESYHMMVNKKYAEAIKVLTEEDKKVKNLRPPTENEKNSKKLEHDHDVSIYKDLASKANSLALTTQSSFAVKQIDSLKVPQKEYQKKLKDYYVYNEEFLRRSFFARGIGKVSDDIAYALAKAIKVEGLKEIHKTIQKAAKETEQIDHEMDKLKKELEAIDQEE
jgi:tetratricopeptide (TPR) repeat protein